MSKMKLKKDKIKKEKKQLTNSLRPDLLLNEKRAERRRNEERILATYLVEKKINDRVLSFDLLKIIGSKLDWTTGKVQKVFDRLINITIRSTRKKEIKKDDKQNTK